MNERKAMRTLGITLAALAIGACGTMQYGVDDPGETGESQFALASGSCPVTAEITALEIIAEHSYTKRTWSVPISRQDIDAHCAGTTTYLAEINLRPGSYTSTVQATDALGIVINDIAASYSSWSIQKGQRTAIQATIKAATGTGTANGSFTVDNASFNEGTVIEGSFDPVTGLSEKTFTFTNSTGRNANDLHLEFNTAVDVLRPTPDPNTFPNAAGKGTSRLDLDGAAVAAGGTATVRVEGDARDLRFTKGYWTLNGANIGAATAN